jgi:hypothetical protein
MQDQLCVKIDISEHTEELPQKAQKVRNRRYKKMIELRESGFFSEDAIKLRHVSHFLFSHCSIIITWESTPSEAGPPSQHKPPSASSCRRICWTWSIGRGSEKSLNLVGIRSGRRVQRNGKCRRRRGRRRNSTLATPINSPQLTGRLCRKRR